MARLSFIVTLAAIISSLPNALAGPACAKKNYQAADCVAKCQSMWGWTGAMMNTDRWGPVIKKVDTAKNWDTVISEACGFAATSATGSASPTPSIASPAANAMSIPALSGTAASVVYPITAIASASSLPASIASVFAKTASSIPSSSVGVSSTRSSTPTASVRSSSLVHVASTASPAALPITTKAIAKPIATTTAAAGAPSSTDSTDDGATSNADIQAYLSAHNTVRAQHGANALTWNDNLASKAQQWANNCVFKHSGGTLGPFGENLAAGTGSSYGIAAAIKSWTDEVSQYNPSSPVASHFTQVVWKATSEVGCAVQSCSGIFAASFGLAKFFVCEYSVQGNVIGEFPENVQV